MKEAMGEVGTYIFRAQVLADGVVGFHCYPAGGDQLHDDVSHDPKQALLVQLPRSLRPLPAGRHPSLDRLPSIDVAAGVATNSVMP